MRRATHSFLDETAEGRDYTRALTMLADSPALVIVTGATGWLGRRLVYSLVAGLPDRPDLHNPTVRVRALAFPGEDTRLLRELGIASRCSRATFAILR